MQILNTVPFTGGLRLNSGKALMFVRVNFDLWFLIQASHELVVLKILVGIAHKTLTHLFG